MTLFQQLKAKQKADKEKGEARLAKRREYARAARERNQVGDGLGDLPVEVAVAVEENSTQTDVPPEPTSQPMPQ